MAVRRVRPVTSDADDPQWYRDAIVYELHIRAFADSNGDGIGDFPGLTSRLDYLQSLGVTALWLLPFYPSPLRDDGYDIADYCDVNPDYGTLADVRTFIREAHARGLRVITELVLNHTSDRHPWFQRSRRAPRGSRWRDWYVWSDDPSRYAGARIIFQDFETSNWTWDDEAGQYYWHRFYSQQPDLNFEHPQVRREMLRVIEFWLSMGVDGLRLDAVPYLFEAEGTTCENLPATHEFLREVRAHMDQRFPGRMLLAEANQWPEDAVAYFGDGDECHMCFHFPVMPRLFMAVRMEDRYPIIDILQQTPAAPDGCQWALFLRNHDELTLEMVTDEERDYMYRAYARDREARINLGIRRRLAPLLEHDRRRIELLNVLLLSLPGTPVLYYGDELGMGDNVYLGDRNGVRTPMQWSADRNAGFSNANPQRLYLPPITDPTAHYEAVNVESQEQNPTSLLWWVRRTLALRRRQEVLSRGTIRFLHPDNPRVLAFVRSLGHEDLLVIANLSRHAQAVQLDLAEFDGVEPVELFGSTTFPEVTTAPYQLALAPHGYYWLSLNRPVSTTSVKRIDLGAVAWDHVFAPGRADELAHAIRRFLPGRPWFPRRPGRVREVTIADVLVLQAAGVEAAALVLADAQTGSTEPERYALPLAVVTGEDALALQRRSPDSVVAELVRDGEVALLFDGDAVPDLATGILRLLGRRRPSATLGGRLVHGRTAAPRRLPAPGSLAASLLEHDEGHSTSVVGSDLVLTAFRLVYPGRNPDDEVSRHLAARGFPLVPPFVGCIELVDRNEPWTLAVVHDLVPHEGEVWTRVVDELVRRFEAAVSDPESVPVDAPPLHGRAVITAARSREPVDDELTLVVSRVGEGLGRLHLALADGRGDPAFQPEPLGPLVRRSWQQSLRSRASRTLTQLRRSQPALPDATAALVAGLLEHDGTVIDLLVEPTRRELTGRRIRVHGDLDLGRIWWTGRDVVFVDFAGDPLAPIGERRLKRTPLVDVASVLRSLDHAAHAAMLEMHRRGIDVRQHADVLEAATRQLVDQAAAEVLRGYLAATDGAAFAPADDDELAALLDATLLDQALAEVGAGLSEHADWLIVPLRIVLGLVQARETRSDTG